MSKSLARVRRAIAESGLRAEVLTPGPSRTAEAAAAACCCDINQIVKSLIFQGESGQVYLFLTAGGNQLDPARAAGVAGEPLNRADAATVRTVTGFAIGGVAPIGHLSAPRIFADDTLLGFATVYAAAGTPEHVFSVEPGALFAACGARIAEFVA